MGNTVSKTILIIDDDESIREYLSSILEEEGFTVIKAENGTVGLARLSTHAVDIIVTDLVMPEKEGIETIREIKKRWSDCKIIAMSGSMNNENYLMITKALGADTVISKPFPPESILSAIEHALS